jgi:hypothetical protein
MMRRGRGSFRGPPESGSVPNLRALGIAAALLWTVPAVAQSRYVQQLIEELRSDSVKVQLQAALLLRQLGDSSAVPALAALADRSSADEAARAAAVGALGVLGGAAAQAAILRAAEDASAWIRAEAMRGIAKQRIGGAVSLVRKAAADRDPRVRLEAQQALALIEPAAAAPPAPVPAPAPPPAPAVAAAPAPAQRVVVEADDSTYYFQEKNPPKTNRERCARAIDKLPRNAKGAKRYLYEMAWAISSDSAREDAAEKVRRIEPKDDDARERARRCCKRVSESTSTLARTIACLFGHLGGKGEPEE